ncbi:uncharacterized protein LOC131634255 [Vicia villosa]|uniref:uncharacterized protein LOC131634255 n=1 Tax=Vicia villosa TaxID=3911 RepID=UPI00273CE35D|nr:uncharacterized protein LOC131634255 [Vicia villosa]
MSVLVNGSPTREFGVSRELRQGDPLSPSLYVIVAEGLTGLVRKIIEVGDFGRLAINGACWVDILQFADVTLIVGDGSWKQMWAIKAVLRAFELVSGLGINYNKSKLIGINTSNNFMEAASYFLSCKVEQSNFYFLGIPVGCNPRKESTWNPILLKKNRLEGWTNRFLNLGGRITLLKSILSSLAIFTMSFYKMPVKVVKKFTRIQNNFLWGGGGIGGKKEDSLARYGDLSSQVFSGGDGKLSSTYSFWWRDILKIGKDSFRDPIVACCNYVVHNGFNTPFWESRWIEGIILKEEYPNLFLASCLKRVSVAAMGSWKKGVWQWGDFGINPVILENTEFLHNFISLRERLEGFSMNEEGKDNVE